MTRDDRHPFLDYVVPFLPFLAMAGLILAIDETNLRPAPPEIDQAPSEPDPIPVVRAYTIPNLGQTCRNPAGEDALRSLVRRLRPEAADEIRIDVYADGPVFLSAAGPNRLVFTQAALNAFDDAQLAALIAHQLVHLEDMQGQMEALGDQNALNMALTSMNPEYPSPLFNSDQEDFADQDAIDMLVAARISLTPAEKMFRDAQVDRMTEGPANNPVAGELTVHPGLPGRARSWGALADEGGDMLLFDQTQRRLLLEYCGARD